MSKKLAIIGAGPVGVEAAARGVDEGCDVSVYDATRVGGAMRRWSHIRLFSPWSLNRSSWSEKRLRSENLTLPPGDEYPTCRQYLQNHLEPLALSIADSVDFHIQTEVLGVSKRGLLKGHLPGDKARADEPFVLHVSGPDGVRYDKADIVFDASGVLSNPNQLGPGGLPALGEEELEDRILRTIPDVHGRHRKWLEGRRVLVVGHGHSALSTLDLLTNLHKEAPKTVILWAFRSDGPPREEIDDDPLPERARLDRFGNRAARGEVDCIEPIPAAMVTRITEADEGLDVLVQQPNSRRTIRVDQLVANVGYRPDTSLTRELQVHLCYATGGPMNLAASLLNASSADCLDQPAAGADLLTNPEPNFYVLGAKSYGRNSNFLLQVGFEQIDAVFESI